ncbi:MAG: hypothetical protein COZ06_16240 [Armatimonadetes bacterium CG_4_10_14_3_um_filter_66_18]|nr:hypothetical protein [Armatimonadota bacterium]OIO99432.1 MAG: hypothetical protein AUJ96_19495 [Armatimonadetes bacterium CG2_30_66_41]PIU95745.1 MAG: hypothetical protein COS65_00870 [Armatimonadetes bacterium CG06_land_8_20_14_3_00_66_21]PIX45767.1 MAG: hypothetical protein COZ57_14410 [Armatimonadetes bacterium CG_4_8_14_3_um_filter_66_20]PIY48583.1 MAG: hypothetical protein COZ06_16240 [Armatimonadetes bacterium CG_4_10_14_3_um_filter_66_18]PIZ40286.1 MAG: hypothetical protein COY42_21
MSRRTRRFNAAAALLLFTGLPAAPTATTRVLVMDFTAGHGATAFLCRELADSLALALMEDGTLDVVPRSQMEQEMDLRGLHAPLSEADALKLAEGLRADRALTGEVELQVRENLTGVKLTVRAVLYEVPLQLAVSGAAVTVQLEAKPDESTSRDRLQLDALSEACARAAKQLRSGSATAGKVLVVDGRGDLHLDIGTREGLRLGARVAIIRSEINPKTAERTVRKLGEAKIVSVGATDAVATPLGQQLPVRSLDQIRLIYELPKGQRK